MVVAAYYPALWGGFVWDDVIFSEEPVIRAPSGLWDIWFAPASIGNEGHYWPVVYTSFYLEYRLWGLWPVGYHAVNLLLHAANTLLAWRLLARLAVPGAWLAAAAFAVHPVHAESVAWVIERKDLLSGLFYLAAALTWTRFAAAPGAGRYALALGLFAAAMLSKSVAVTLPAALLLWHWWRDGRVTLRDVVLLAPFFAVGLAIALGDYGYYAGREPLELGRSPLDRVLTAARALWFYAGKLAWPTDLAVIYPRWQIDAADPLGWAFVAAAAAAAAALWRWRDRIGRGPLAGAAFFALTLSPMLGFVDYGYLQFSFVADRFQYLACLGPLALAAAAGVRGAARLRRSGRAVVGTLAAAALVACGVLSWRQAGVYRDDVELFGHIVALNPNARDAHLNLGSALLRADRIEEGLAATRIAAAQRPEADAAHTNLGRAMLALGRIEEAEAALARALEVNPRDPSALQNTGELHRRAGRLAEAEKAYRAVLAVDPDFALAHAALGDVLFSAGRYAEALETMGRASALRPDLDSAGSMRLLMGRAAREMGRLDEAAAHFRDAVEMLPDAIEPSLELADLYGRQGRSAAADALRRQLRMARAGDVGALHALGEALRQRDRLDDAMAVFEDVLALDADNGPTQAALGLALYDAGRPEEAVAALSAALKEEPKLGLAASLRLYLGHALRDLGRGAEALEEYALAAEADPASAQALDHLAMALFDADRLGEALARYRALAALDPGSAAAEANIGAVLHRLGRDAEALTHVRRALALEPDLATARVGREAVCRALGLDPARPAAPAGAAAVAQDDAAFCAAAWAAPDADAGRAENG